MLVALAVSAQSPPADDAFYRSIRSNDLPTLRALVRDHGVNTADALGQTPLMLAAAFGTPDAVRFLLDAGADVNARSKSGVTALHWGATEPAKVRLLLDAKADVNAVSQLGRTPLIVAAAAAGTGEVVRLLVARGADVNATDASGITPLIAAAAVDDLEVAQLLLVHGANPAARANVAQSATPLLGAAYNGNAELTRALLLRRVDLSAVSAEGSGIVKNGRVAFGKATALHMGVASGNAEVVKLLLDAGAAVDPADMRGMTPLMWSVSTDRPQPTIVKLLIARGAQPTARSLDGESVVDWARKFSDPTVMSELAMRPVSAAAVAPPTAAHVLSTRQAVERTLPLLRSASGRMMTDGGCVACHAQPMNAIVTELARARGWAAVPAAADAAQGAATLSAQIPMLMQIREGGGWPDTQVYIAMTMAAQQVPSSRATDALVHFLAAKQRREGNWHGIGATRAPMQDGDFSRTALSIRALAVYATPARATEYKARMEHAAQWLSQQTPITTEDRVMQLLGLTWADAHADVVARRASELKAIQRSDGGWAQTPHLVSDAYATGQALYALRQVGVAAADPVLQSGAGFLLRTQRDDGSWYVKSRAMKIQPYFQSGFPYEHDQWISQTGTSWAAMGLTVTALE